MSERTPYVGFSNETLAKQPELKAGDTITCPRCNGSHVVSESKSKNGTVALLFYKCGEDAYLAGISGRNIVGVKADASGEF